MMSKSATLTLATAAAAVALSLGGRVSAPSAAAQDKGTEDSPAGKVSVEAWIKKHELWLERLEKGKKQLSEVLNKKLVDSDQLLKDQARQVKEDLGRQFTQMEKLLPPLGSAIPYFGGPDNLPDGYVLADGRAHWPNAEWVPSHLRGRSVPNLNGRVARGASESENVGTPGGSDSVPAHSTAGDGSHQHRIPDHAHGLPPTTGSNANGGPDPGGHPYLVRDDNHGWQQDNHLTTEHGGGGSEGQHRHDLGGTTAGSGVLASVAGDGVHQHQIGAVAYRPSYVAVFYVIRIK